MDCPNNTTNGPNPARLSLMLFATLTLFYLFVAGGHLYNMDDHTNYYVAEGLILRGSPAILIPDEERHLNTTVGHDGRRYSYYGLGAPVLFIPFVLAGKVAGSLIGGQHYVAQGVLSLFNAFTTSLTAVFIYLVCMSFGRPSKTSLIAALIYALATPALVWSKQPSNTVIVGLCFLYSIWLILRGSNKSALLAGIVLGLAVNVRYDAAIGVLLIPGALLLMKRLTTQHLLRICLGGLPFVFVLIGYNMSRFGSPFELGYTNLQSESPFGTPLFVGLYGLLFSPNRGIFFFSPILLSVFAGVPFLCKKGNRAGLLFLLIPLTYTIFFSKAETWHAGLAWGPRYLAIVLPLFCCALSYVSFKRTAFRYVVIVLFAFSFVIQAWGSLSSIDSYHDYLVENKINPLDTATDPRLSPIWGSLVVVRQFSLERISDKPPDEALPAGGYNSTLVLRATPDYWPFYAYKIGIPFALAFLPWIVIGAASGYGFCKLASTLR